MKKNAKKPAPKPVAKKSVPRVKKRYVVEFRMEIEQDETGDDKIFEAIDSIRVDLETLQNSKGGSGGHVHYLRVIDVGVSEDEEEW